MGKQLAGITQEPDGTWRVRKSYRGNLICRRFGTDFEEAQGWLIRELERLRKVDIHGGRMERTFEEAATRYLEINPDKVSLETEIYMLKSALPHVGHLALHQVHNDTLRPFIEARRQAGRKNKTINLALGVVRHILNLAARDWRDGNGMTWLETPPMITMLPLTDQREPRPITWEEQRRLLPALPDHLARMALFILNSGARDNVVRKLRWDWEIPVPEIGLSVFLVPREFVKGRKSDRYLILNRVAQNIVDSQRENGSDHVFVYNGKPIRDRLSNNAWQRGRETAGLGDLHVHDLRHTVGMRLREAGVGEETRSDILWHSRASMAQHYAVGQVMELASAMEKIAQEHTGLNRILRPTCRPKPAHKRKAG